jgi:hypothetical protein
MELEKEIEKLDRTVLVVIKVCTAAVGIAIAIVTLYQI